MRINNRWVIAIAGVFLQIALGALGLSGGRRRVREKVLAALHRKHRRLRFGVPGDVKADRFSRFFVLRVAGSHAAGIGHGVFAYRQSDPRCNTKRDAGDNSNMMNLCARIIVG